VLLLSLELSMIVMLRALFDIPAEKRLSSGMMMPISKGWMQ
jgi:hypothetical protein